MIDFFKKIYSILLRQNSSWLEQFAAIPNRPLLAGLLLIIGYVIVLAIFNLTTTSRITVIVLGFSSILFSLSGLLWMRDGRFPYYITGIFKGSSQYQKIQAVIWIAFWGGMGFLLIVTSFME